MNILDLDDNPTWSETYKRFVEEDPYGSVIEDALSQKKDKEISRILGNLHTNIEHIDSREHLSFRDRLIEMFRRTYTDVAAYHACRPINPQLYYDKGIISSDPEVLIEEARNFFRDFPDIETVLGSYNEVQAQEYLNYGRNTVGFFFSRTDALENSQFLKYGSELFFFYSK